MLNLIVLHFPQQLLSCCFIFVRNRYHYILRYAERWRVEHSFGLPAIFLDPVFTSMGCFRVRLYLVTVRNRYQTCDSPAYTLFFSAWNVFVGACQKRGLVLHPAIVGGSPWSCCTSRYSVNRGFSGRLRSAEFLHLCWLWSFLFANSNSLIVSEQQFTISQHISEASVWLTPSSGCGSSLVRKWQFSMCHRNS